MIRKFAEWLRDIVLAAFVAVLVILFLYQPVKVEGTSMAPSLEDQQRVFVNKFIYRTGIVDIERGDTVVFWSPTDPDRSYIKRVIGLPGDVVESREGVIYINRQPLVEPYIDPRYLDLTPITETIVPANSYFVLGDHRNSSQDSRNWGPVPSSAIYGKAVLVYWPLDRLGVIR